MIYFLYSMNGYFADFVSDPKILLGAFNHRVKIGSMDFLYAIAMLG